MLHPIVDVLTFCVVGCWYTGITCLLPAGCPALHHEGTFMVLCMYVWEFT